MSERCNLKTLTAALCCFYHKNSVITAKVRKGRVCVRMSQVLTDSVIVCTCLNLVCCSFLLCMLLFLFSASPYFIECFQSFTLFVQPFGDLCTFKCSSWLLSTERHYLNALLKRNNPLLHSGKQSKKCMATLPV